MVWPEEVSWGKSHTPPRVDWAVEGIQEIMTNKQKLRERKATQKCIITSLRVRINLMALDQPGFFQVLTVESIYSVRNHRSGGGWWGGRGGGGCLWARLGQKPPRLKPRCESRARKKNIRVGEMMTTTKKTYNNITLTTKQNETKKQTVAITMVRRWATNAT